MPLSPDDMMSRVTANLPQKTGKTLQEWIQVLRTQGPPAAAKHGERVNWLKTQHQIGHVTAEIITYEAEKPDDYQPPSDDELIAAQYAGEKASLLPIYEQVIALAKGLGADVQTGTRQSYVAFSRKRQFALVQPTTKTRVDLGLRLDGVPPTERLKAAGSFGSGGITHRVALASAADVDGEVESLLRQAYAKS